MKVLYQTKKNWNYILFFNCCILGSLIFSCTCQKLKIQHLPFFDNLSDVYRILDTDRTHPYSVKSMYFSINQRSLKCINLNELDHIIKSDSVIQNQLKRGYYEVNVMFYKASSNLDKAIREQSHKLLTLSNNDIVAEYIWEEGKLKTTFYYEDGRIKGSEKVKLEDLPKSFKN